MPLNIPNVPWMGDAAQRGVESGTNLWQQLLGQGVNLGRMHQQGQQFEKTLGFNEKQLAQQNAHHQDTFSIQKAQLAMQKQLIPHQIQALVDAHKLAPWQAKMLEANMYAHIADAEQKLSFASAFGNTDYQTGSLMSQFMRNQGGQPNQMFGGNSMNAQAPDMNQGDQYQQPMSQNVQNGPMGGPIAQPPIPTGPMGAPSQRQNINIPYAEQPQRSTAPEMPNDELVGKKLIDPSDLKMGEKAEIIPAKPGLEKRDRLVGMQGFDTKEWADEGVHYTKWPSGKVEAQRTGKSPEQKAELETQKKEQQETNKLNAKEYQSLKKEIPKAEEMHNNVKDLIKLYEKNQGHKDEWWGGFFPFIPTDAQIKTRELQIKNGDFGAIKTKQAKLIGPQAEEFSSKPLAMTVALAQDVKPGFYENFENSLGKLKQIDKDMEIAIKREKARMAEVGPERKENAKMLKGIDSKGIEWDIRPEDKEAFIESGGKI